MQIDNHKVVSFHYTLTNESGALIDSSEGRDPLIYLHGEENIIHGLELALEGKGVGDKLNASIDPADAYGEFDPAMVEIVSSEMFDGVDNIEVGMEFQAETPDGEGVQMVRISDVDGDNVTVDGNHPLAGQQLNFDVAIVDIREATEEEIEHGHVHGAEECGSEGGCGSDDCCSS